MIRNITIIGLLVSIASLANLNNESIQPVAKVGSITITNYDVHNRLIQLPKNNRQSDRYQWALDQLINEAILIHQAKKNGLHRTKAYAENLQIAKRTLLLESMITQLIETAPGISDAEVSQVYQNNPTLFEAIHQRRFQYHVSETLTEAKTHYASLVQNPRSLTLTPGSWITQNYPNRPIANAVFSLAAIGDISTPIRTETGYYIIRLIGINKTPKQNEAESLAMIKSELQFEQQQALIDAYIDQVSDTLNIKRY